LGCADIARKLCVSVQEAESARIVAVASRDAGREDKDKKARAWADANAPPGTVAHETYEALLGDDTVQVVYIPLPTAMRKQWVLKAAAAGKHVLCEKPVAIDLQDAQEMVEACRASGVQFMDNTMFMHHGRLEEMRKAISDREGFGRVKHVVSAFSIPFGNQESWAKENIRMNAETEPFGALGDLGWYNIRISLWAFDWEMPTAVRCDYLETTAQGVPVTCHAMLSFKDGRSATFDCSFKGALRQWVEIVGENKMLSCDDFVVNQKEDSAEYTIGEGGISDKALTFPKVSTTFAMSGKACKSNVRLIERMSSIVCSIDASGKTAFDQSWLDTSVQTQRIMWALHLSGAAQGKWVDPATV